MLDYVRHRVSNSLRQAFLNKFGDFLKLLLWRFIPRSWPIKKFSRLIFINPRIASFSWYYMNMQMIYRLSSHFTFIPSDIESLGLKTIFETCLAEQTNV